MRLVLPILSAALLALPGLLHAQEAEPLFPDKGSLALVRAASVILEVLDPDSVVNPKSKGSFRGYQVLSRVIVSEADLEQVRDLLQRNCRPVQSGDQGAPFRPTFGVRLVHDAKTYDFALSFETHRLRYWAKDPHPLEYELAGSGDTFLEIFHNHDIPARPTPTPNPLRALAVPSRP